MITRGGALLTILLPLVGPANSAIQTRIPPQSLALSSSLVEPYLVIGGMPQSMEQKLFGGQPKPTHPTVLDVDVIHKNVLLLACLLGPRLSRSVLQAISFVFLVCMYALTL